MKKLVKSQPDDINSKPQKQKQTKQLHRAPHAQMVRSKPQE